MSQAQQIKVSDKAEALVENLKENKVIGRKEIKIKVYHIGSPTPSRADIRKAISSFIGAKEDLVVIRKINTGYGAGISEATIHVYSEKDVLSKFEPAHLVNRGNKAKTQGEASG
ncbi:MULTISPECIES: 30S ribosomal protein S24e [Metallosphaera]|uniref:Small ribosomal subunit protein eS24 n=3 Tax=Metallosphaera TaxID=41980 RepID=RS24_METS5|nr:MULTISPECIES: 30S ribosomal protein S24e [Metallosphaera]A4YIV8.1 RecName: Full=Small ribosomal subunit protein eS24; AltName: Full=30S ribosomal protein S24e [Metallosphaera sedula DSM 5348]ABP96360.1 SSU ribosomal protein S24E [Metallosphaera sedula DSM 5348]AIM28343.1 SSU ribosomal protein S24E [Metallosphaera sedula]AKV75140.1 30S ribosomal protein S24 [Metallosphaera sedula]AKV77378.1 30S ribosomal protein S24 [Metallosphaera sedula]AKV79629.1 30S ribosomal protein S24 [Metallosphaera